MTSESRRPNTTWLDYLLAQNSADRRSVCGTARIDGINLCCAQASGQKVSRAWIKSGTQVDAVGTDVSPTMKCLSQAEFGNFLGAVPSLEEQAAIVRFLDREPAKSDALVEGLRRMIALLQEKREAGVITKGLNPSVTMKSTGAEGPDEMPEQWELRAMRSVANVASRAPVAEGPRNHLPEVPGKRTVETLRFGR
jgi:hypothetical protein